MRTRFIDACRRQPVDRTPIWLMRQAGRYMPAYRQLRKTYGILDIIKNPDLALEVTLQPINAFDLDAAIIFADILPLLEGMGLGLDFIKGTGPVIHNPIQQATDIERLREPDPRESMAFTLEAVSLAQRVLADKLPLIGFSGAPFTLACYAIEGGSSRHFALAKTLMYEQPRSWHQLMEKLTTRVGEYLVAQAEAGAQVLQVFDTWMGVLSPADYREFVLPYSTRVIRRARESHCPVIHFGTNTSAILPLIKASGADVVGVDWRIEISAARQILGQDVVLQGNLDPVQLFAPVPTLQRRAQAILDQMADDPGFIFNLGHGILPTTPMDHVTALIDFVHSYKVQHRIEHEITNEVAAL